MTDGSRVSPFQHQEINCRPHVKTLGMRAMVALVWSQSPPLECDHDSFKHEGTSQEKGALFLVDKWVEFS